MAKKENTSVIVPTAEVRLGNYVVRLTEKDLRGLKDVHDYVKDSLKDYIFKVQDYIISTYDDFTKEHSSEIVELLSGLHGYIDFFKCLGEIDIKYDKSSNKDG